MFDAGLGVYETRGIIISLCLKTITAAVKIMRLKFYGWTPVWSTVLILPGITDIFYKNFVKNVRYPCPTKLVELEIRVLDE